MYNQQNMNCMWNSPNNMYGMCGHNMCNCNCGCYNPCQQIQQCHIKSSSYECYKRCEPYRDFATYLLKESGVIGGQYVVGEQVYNDLQTIISRLETELKELENELVVLIPQVEEAKKKYDECIVACERHESEMCNCECNCECCNGKDEAKGYCTQCEGLREAYVSLDKRLSLSEGIILELGEQIVGLKSFANMKQKRYELQKAKAESLQIDAQKYEKKYEDCKSICKMDSGCGCS
ncbi:MAG: hypothetical protein ACRCXT_00935 [Paraclostridium sp.]